MDEEMFSDDSDDDGDDAVFMIPGLFAGGGADGSHMVNNSDDWHEGAWPITLADVAVTTLGLAVNITGALSIFFRDLRHDMCAARNHGSRRRIVAEFDNDLAGLPTHTAITDA